MITFRIAEKEDVDWITDLLNSVIKEFAAKGITMWQKGYPNRGNIEEDIGSGNAYIAEIDGIPSGYMYIRYGAEEFHSTLRGKWEDDNCTVMHRLLTDPSSRGHGLGTAMMQFWEEKSRNAGYTSMRTETDETNIPMRSLMKKCGFEEKGLLTFDNSDKVGFEKIL